MQSQHTAELAAVRSQHAAELAAVRAEERERGGRHTAAVKEWARINQAQLWLQNRSRQQAQQQGHAEELAAHKKELAARAARAETWRKKRHNQLRATERLRAGREAAQGQVREQKVELRELTTDNDALHAEVGDRIKVSQQRMYEGSRTPFTYKTILRDLLARQCTLNAGAQHIRELTALYSSMIAADGNPNPNSLPNPNLNPNPKPEP